MSRHIFLLKFMYVYKMLTINYLRFQFIMFSVLPVYVCNKTCKIALTYIFHKWLCRTLDNMTVTAARWHRKVKCNKTYKTALHYIHFIKGYTQCRIIWRWPHHVDTRKLNKCIHNNVLDTVIYTVICFEHLSRFYLKRY